VGSIVPEKAQLKTKHPDNLSAFNALFNGAATDGSNSVKPDEMHNSGVKTVESAKQRVIKALKAGKDKRAARAAFAFGAALWGHHLYGSAEDAYLFGAALRAGLSKRAHLDLSNATVREALFSELAKVRLTEDLDTSAYKPEFALGESWPLFKRFVGGHEFGTFTQMLVGTGLMLKTFSDIRVGLPSLESIQPNYRIPRETVRNMLESEIDDLEAMRQHEIPVITIHHIGTLTYLREYIQGSVLDAIDHPLIGLTQDQILDVKHRWYERAMQIREAGLWKCASEYEMQGSLVYSLELQDWVVVDTLSSARNKI